MRRKNKGLGLIFKLLGIGFLVLLLLGSLGWVYRSNLLTGSLDVVLAEQGSIEHNQTLTAVFANEEVLIKAPSSGKPVFLGKEGERFRKGEQVAVMQPEGAVPGQSSTRTAVQVVAPVGGLLFYKVDGFESVLAPENLLEIDLSKAFERSNTAKKETEVVQNGSTIGKIVNNLRPTVAIIKGISTESTLGKSLKLNINNQAYSAKIVRLLDEQEGVVVQFNQYVEGTAERRMQEISWTSKPSKDGVIVPKSTLWNKGEEQGVYVVTEGIIQFRKVKVLDENEKGVCIEGLPHGIPVIINPRSGLEGLTMNAKLPSQE